MSILYKNVTKNQQKICFSQAASAAFDACIVSKNLFWFYYYKPGLPDGTYIFIPKIPTAQKPVS
jgi:hypothetical protein